MPGDGKHFTDEHRRQAQMLLRGAAGVGSARHSLIACTEHLHESTVAESGSLLKRLMQALQQAAPDSPRPFSLVSMKRRIKGASRLSVSPQSLNGAGWVVVSSATTGTFTDSSFQRKNLKMCARPRSLVARHWGYVIVVRN